MPHEGKPNQVTREITLELVYSFVDKLNSLVKNSENEKFFFDRAPESLWQKFNEYKQASYLSSAKRLMNYSKSQQFGVEESKNEEIYHKPINYIGSSIEITEDRFQFAYSCLCQD